MAELEAAETAAPELTKAEQKKKDEELTPAELLAYGILPPQPEKPKPVEGPHPETPDEGAVASPKSNNGSK